MGLSTFRIAAAIANHLGKNGLKADIEHSKRSNSKYVYASIPEDDVWDHWDEMQSNGLKPDKMKTIRISDHQNPATRFFRQSDSNDRAIETDHEIRTDQDQSSNWKNVAQSVATEFEPELSFLRNKQRINKQDGGPVDNGITAYHGSPHDFNQFDTSKIGTGEGAQAYGHGLYFAEHEPVAEGYRSRLAGHIPGAVKIGDETHPHWATKDVANAFKKLGYDHQTSVIAAHQIKEHQGDLAKAGAEIWDNEHVPDSVHEALINTEYATPAGHMYEVHIDAHPDHFLDWDKPLSDQSDHVQSKIGSIMRTTAHERNTMPIRTFYEMLGTPQEASQRLSNAGIRGIRYLDAGSRGASDQPTHNYVVFDHNRVKVKRKYEQGGLVDSKSSGGTPKENLDYRKTINSPVVEHVLNKISAPLPALDPHLMAVKAGRRY